MQPRRFVALSLVSVSLLLGLGGCEEYQRAIKGEKGEPGAPGPAGPRGPAGPPGAATVIRSVDGECSLPCIVACEANERILSAYAINPGGTFTFESENRATFRPQRPDPASKVVVACIPK